MQLDKNLTYSSYRWVIVSLLFLATINNYFHRSVFSVVIIEIRRELSINDLQYSYILSIFQFAYMFGFLAAGKFIDWAGTRLGYMLSILFWSVAASMQASVGSAFSLATWRGLLGISESGNFPATVKSVAEWFPQKERSFSTALFNSAPHFSMIAGPPIIAFLILALGWRWALLVLGSRALS